MKKFARELMNVAFVLAGILSAGMGLKGVSALEPLHRRRRDRNFNVLADVAGLPLSIWILLINLPFVAVGYRQIGRKFALKSALAIAGLSDPHLFRRIQND